jgi:hypothetical protein
MVVVGGGAGVVVVVVVVGAVVLVGVVDVGDVAWVVPVGCDPALTGAPLLLPQPAASAAVRSRVSRARPISAA